MGHLITRSSVLAGWLVAWTRRALWMGLVCVKRNCKKNHRHVPYLVQQSYNASSSYTHASIRVWQRQGHVGYKTATQ